MRLKLRCRNKDQVNCVVIGDKLTYIYAHHFIGGNWSMGYQKAGLFVAFCAGISALLFSLEGAADVDLPTKFSNQGGIINTRHNLTQSSIGAGATTMNPYRNDYGEVCVYCHTPHGANGTIDAPLWNRTIKNTTYTTYSDIGGGSLTQSISQPGMNSLTCLSCHDGTLGVDSVINMPGNSYSAGQESSQDNAFLNTWTNASGADASVHLGLDAVTEGDGCLACHSPDAGIVGAGATDFRAFALGTDLRDDHPIGVTLPVARVGTDFRGPGAVKGNITFFDKDGDNRPDSDEVRFYDTGDGPEVECASCHDPHGVPIGAFGTTNKASFLRVSNQNGSGLCLTCHDL